MGLFDKVKGFLNLGGPKIKIVMIKQPILSKSGIIEGAAHFTTERAAKIVKFSQKFYRETTKGSGDDRKTETVIIAEQDQSIDLELKANDRVEWPIMLPYDSTSMSERIANKGGMLGALGKATQFASGFMDQGSSEYFFEVGIDVVGTPLDPTDKMQVQATLDQ